MDTQTNNQTIQDYVNRNSVATLGTVNEDGTPHGAVVYVYADTPLDVYFVTKDATKKFQNASRANHVSLTIYNTLENSTLQANGTASLVDDPALLKTTANHIAKVILRGSDWLSPADKLDAGLSQLVRVHLDTARLGRYGGAQPGDKRIFTELLQ